MRKPNPKTVHVPVAGYSHQIEIAEPVRWLVLSGQIGMRLDGTIPTDPAEQLRVALDNLRLNLEEAGMDVSHVVKMTIYLADRINPEQRRAVFDGWLGDHKPCLTLLYVAGLAGPDLKVEIDAWACEGLDGN